MRKQRVQFGPILVLVGGLIALFGTYWDDSWHTDRGRDTFFVPPHLLLYSGVMLAGIAVGLWAFQMFLTTRTMRALFRHPPLVLAAVGTATTIASAPIDEAWHRLFGRDAVLWSPPHMLGVIALLGVAVGTLLELGSMRGGKVRLLASIAAALVIGTLMVPVMEYESDVPQFALRWYLPVLTGCATFAFLLIERIGQGQWPITTAAALYTIMRVSIVGFLLILDHSTSIIPPIVLPALVFDLTGRAAIGKLPRAVLVASSIALIYSPYLRIVPGGLVFTATDILIGLPIAIGVSWLLLVLATGPRATTVVRAASIGFGIVVVAITPTPTFAHDPGQGDDVGQAAMTVVQGQAGVTVTVTLIDHTHAACDDVVPLAVVGRRAGTTVRMPLQRIGGCQFAGDISLNDPGRWFVYAEWQHAVEKLESWVPVQVDATRQGASRVSALYRPAQQSGSRGQRVTGVVLYGINALLLGGIFWACYRPSTRMELEMQHNSCA